MLVRVGHAILVPEADGIAQPFADDSKGHMFRKALNLAPFGRRTLCDKAAQRRLAPR